MDLIEDNTKEKAMSRIEGGSTTESEATKSSKNKTFLGVPLFYLLFLVYARI